MRVQGFGFRVGVRVSDFGFRVSGFGFRVSGFEFRVSGFGSMAGGDEALGRVVRRRRGGGGVHAVVVVVVVILPVEALQRAPVADREVEVDRRFRGVHAAAVLRQALVQNGRKVAGRP